MTGKSSAAASSKGANQTEGSVVDSEASSKTRRSSAQESLDGGRRPRSSLLKKMQEWEELLNISTALEGVKGPIVGADSGGVRQKKKKTKTMGLVVQN